MPYFNTNDKELANNFVNLINKKLGYNGAVYFVRVKPEFIEKYGLYRTGLNMGQATKTGIDPKLGSGFTEEEVIELLKDNQ
ncbi:MAG: hypothetical protein PF572_05800 [Patescibacteria group bacterium]|jgi:hypothetical protein|nr:hypothetical protein [Patescibacteria group bacterium]